MKPGDDGLSRAAFYGLLAGSTSLIPIPLLDDWAFQFVRRGMWKDILEHHGVVLDPKQLKSVLQRSTGRRGGCVYQTVFAGVVFPFRLAGYFFRSLARKILFVLAAKQASDRAAEFFHEVYLVDCAGRKGLLRDAATVGQVLSSLEESLQGLNLSPVWGVFYGVARLHKGLLRQAASVLSGMSRRARRSPGGTAATPSGEDLRREQRILGDLIRRVADVLGGEKDYLSMLERRFESSWKARTMTDERNLSDVPERGTMNEEREGESRQEAEGSPAAGGVPD